MSQPFGKDAQQYLAKLILGKEVCVMWQKRDREAPRVGRLEIWRFGDWGIGTMQVGGKMI